MFLFTCFNSHLSGPTASLTTAAGGEGLSVRRREKEKRPKSLLPLCNQVKHQKATVAQEACVALASKIHSGESAFNHQHPDIHLFAGRPSVLGLMDVEGRVRESV